MSLNVDQNVIFSMLLGEEDIEVESSQLKDYHIIFKTLGLKHQYYRICMMVEKIKTFSELLNALRELSEKEEENDTIKSWFSLSPSLSETISEENFNTALSLSLFNQMKFHEHKIRENVENFGLVGVNIIQYHLAKYEQSVDVKKHKDFSGCDLDSLSSLSLLKKLYEDKRLTNIILRSNDGVDFPCHKEILILRFNFFHLMFRFRGAEVQEYEETGRIRLEDVSSNMCTCLLSYAYKRDLEIKNDLDGLELVIRIICHSHQFNETDLFELCLHKLSEIAKKLGQTVKGEGVLGVVSNVGLMLHINDEVRKAVVPALAKLVKCNSEDFVTEMIKKSYELHEEKEKNKILEDENGLLKEENERLNRLIESLGDDSSVFGGGRVRKRGNDDEKVEEENPKKRRKKE